MFAQIIAICIFVTMFLLIILDKFERHYITLGSGALVLVLVFQAAAHFIIKAEERECEATLGDEYRAYCQRVRRYL